MSESAKDRALSKRLAYILRHKPDDFGITLGPGGWVQLDVLLAALEDSGQPSSRAAVEAMMAAATKTRYEISDGQIRASQGHSIGVDLGLSPMVPPAVLFHGTVDRYLEAINAEGLRPMNRDHVHLSAEVETATSVGSRRGRPIVLTIDAAAMHAAGHDFFQAANGVWLAAAVPPTFISEPS